MWDQPSPRAAALPETNPPMIWSYNCVEIPFSTGPSCCSLLRSQATSRTAAKRARLSIISLFPAVCPLPIKRHLVSSPAAAPALGYLLSSCPSALETGRSMLFHLQRALPSSSPAEPCSSAPRRAAAARRRPCLAARPAAAAAGQAAGTDSRQLVVESLVGNDGGPPRMISPLVSGVPTEGRDALPLLIYLPGIDGTGLAAR